MPKLLSIWADFAAAVPETGLFSILLFGAFEIFAPAGFAGAAAPIPTEAAFAFETDMPPLTGVP